ncbi:MAG: dihydrodipicolinate synthase family protein [Phycisphaerae bacterium]
MDVKLYGIMPAITSPCDENDRFLEDTFTSLANYLCEQGVHGLYVCGATGDSYRLRTEERKRILKIAMEVCGPFGAKVITHVGATSTREAVELAEHASSVGAAAVSSMPPANRSNRELVDYYRDVAKAAQLPVLIYHIPQLTNHNLPFSVFQELLDIPGVAGVKFSGSNVFLMRRLLLARSGVSIFNGDDELLVPALLYGACGGIGMTYNLFPKLFVAMYEAVLAGDIARAMHMQDCHVIFLHRAIEYGLCPVFDLLMRERGFGPFSYRKPRTVLDEACAKKFHQEVDPLIAAIDRAANDLRKIPEKKITSQPILVPHDPATLLLRGKGLTHANQ